MKSKDIEVLQFLHDRLIHVHGENKNVDYLHALRRIIEGKKEDMQFAKYLKYTGEENEYIKYLYRMILEYYESSFPVKIAKWLNQKGPNYLLELIAQKESEMLGAIKWLKKGQDEQQK